MCIILWLPQTVFPLCSLRDIRTSSVILHYLSDGKVSTGHHLIISSGFLQIQCHSSATYACAIACNLRNYVVGIVGHGIYIYIYNMSIEDDVTYLALYLQIIRHTLLIQYCCSIKNKASFPFPVEREMMMMMTTTTTTTALLCWHEWGTLHLDHSREFICEPKTCLWNKVMGGEALLLLPHVGGGPFWYPGDKGPCGGFVSRRLYV